jgi:hypothetical protein
VLNIDSRIAVLVTLIAAVIALTGLAFLLVGAWIPGVVMLALGLIGSGVGYGSLSR